MNNDIRNEITAAFFRWRHLVNNWPNEIIESQKNLEWTFQSFWSESYYARTSTGPVMTAYRIWIKNLSVNGMGIIQDMVLGLLSQIPLFRHFSTSRNYQNIALNSYLTGVVTAELQWHMSNMNVKYECNQNDSRDSFAKWKNITNGEISGGSFEFSNPLPCWHKTERHRKPE